MQIKLEIQLLARSNLCGALLCSEPRRARLSNTCKEKLWIQVAALATLIGIAAGPEAGLLGSGWPAVLRTLSSLHALQVR